MEEEYLKEKRELLAEAKKLAENKIIAKADASATASTIPVNTGTTQTTSVATAVVQAATIVVAADNAVGAIDLLNRVIPTSPTIAKTATEVVEAAKPLGPIAVGGSLLITGYQYQQGEISGFRAAYDATAV